MEQTLVDTVKVEDIKIHISNKALEQIKLILDNDYTLGEQQLRLKVDGKGCNGFDYAIGFTEKEKDDLELPIEFTFLSFKILLDPFTAFYCKEGTIDYIQDFANDTEGFTFENANEKKYRGKFFKNSNNVPPVK